ncbi:MAG: amidohydrolase family protein, partial [Desulfobacterales bacterium]
ARDFVMEFVPPPDAGWLKKAALAAQADALRLGLTGVHTCETLDDYRALADLEAQGLLKLRVHHNLPPYHLDQAADLGLAAGQGSDHLWAGHLKLFADGSLGSGTALIHEPYCDETDNCGLPFLDADDLITEVLRGHERGYSVAIHAIGDKAGTHALNAIARGRERFPGPWRDRVEHVQLHHPDDLRRYQALDVTASVQPIFVGTDWQVAERRWGARRLPYAYSWKTLMDHGLRVQFGSDAPVEPIAPILGIQAAVLRQDRQHQPQGGWRPEEKLTLEESLAGYFRTAAWSSGKEDRLGALKPGNLADLTVFAEDLTAVDPARWDQVAVEMTIIDGEIAYQKES